MFLVRISEFLVGFFLLLCMYWSPTMIAFGRRTRRLGALAALNTLLGWTIIGWLIAFLWSVAAKPETAATVAIERRPRSLEVKIAPVIRFARS